MSNNSWFAIFGENAQFIQVTVDLVLALLFVCAICAFLIRFALIAIQAKTSEDDETRVELRKKNVGNLIGVGISALIATATFLIINLIPAPNNADLVNSVFVYLDRNHDPKSSVVINANKIFNIVMAVLIGLLILSFIVTSSMRVVQYISADDVERRATIRKHGLQNVAWLLAGILVLFFGQIIIGVVGPREILKIT